MIVDFGCKPTRRQYRLSPEPKRNRIQLGIIAIDGEGRDITDNYQAYNLLYASNGSYLSAYDLSENPSQILEWILALPDKPLKVAYAFDYDITMWLRKLPKSTLKHLWKNGWVHYGPYRLTYKAHHQFIVTKNKVSRTVWDQFRFYQQSFVASLFEWNVGSQSIREQIFAMKSQRDNFANISDEQVKAYCASECDLLVDLTTELLQATINAGVKLRRYDGAGAIANSLMSDHEMAIYNKALPIRIQNAVLSAYYGGRTEVAMTGKIGHAYTYDINSAYPSMMASLPCCAHLKWQERSKYSRNLTAVWRVSWDVRGKPDAWGPFPFRLTDGRISYPLSGKGWYWTPEVQAALDIWGAECIKIDKGYSAVPGCTHAPFDWVEPLYYHRQKLKAEGNAAQRVLKLGINAIYGKTAQSIGYKDVPPKYSNFVWAGLITSGCRAKVYRAIMSDPSNVISSATDGIISLSPLDLPVSNKLGEWEGGTVDALWIYQPGVTSSEVQKHPTLRSDGTCLTCKRDGKEPHLQYKTRGFTPREVDVQSMQQEYIRDPVGRYRYTTRRFIGLGAGLQRKDYEIAIGQWVTMPRQVSFCPSQRLPRASDVLSIARGCPPASMRVDPLSSPPAGQLESALYIPKMTWTERWDDDDMDFDALVDSAQP